MTFRFLHTADLHLGTPFQGLGKRFSEPWAARLREAADSVFLRIVELAVSRDVDFVTIAGDLFDSDQAAMGAQFALLRGFQRLQEAGIAALVIHGNHDFVRRDREMVIRWPANVTVLEASSSPATPHHQDPSSANEVIAPSRLFTVRDGRRVQVSGFSYHRKDLYGSRHMAYLRHPEADFAIGLYHGAIGDSSGHEPYCATSVNELATRDFDFWGLGHVHQPQILRQLGPVVVYPGNPQGRSLRETGQRGCTLVTVDDDGGVQLEFLQTATVEWHTDTIDLSGCDEFPQVVQRVCQALERKLTHPDLGMVVHLSLTGRTKVHALLAEENVLEELAEDISSRLPQVCIARLTATTLPNLDFSRLEHSAEFVGEFLRLSRVYLEQPERILQDFGSVLEEVFHSGNELSLEEMTPQQLRELVKIAQSHVMGFAGEVTT